MKIKTRFSSPFIFDNEMNKDLFNNNGKVHNVIDNAPYELSILYTILSLDKEKIKRKLKNGNS